VAGADGLDVFLLEVLKKDVFGTEEGMRGEGEHVMLRAFCKLLEDRLAWQTSPFDGVSVEKYMVKWMCRKKKDHLINEGT